MIALDSESVVVNHIRLALGHEFPQLHDVATAVEHYCDIHGPDRAITGHYLDLLLARVLIKSGHAQEARRLLKERTEAADPCFAVLSQEPCPHRIMKSLSARLVRPSRWAVTGGHVTWTVDLRRLMHDPLAQLELGILPAVRALLDEAAALWDESRGAGSLAVRGLDSLSFDRHEIPSFCRHWLEATAKRRGWNQIPDLLLLDPE